MRKIVVNKKFNNKKLDSFLLDAFNGLKFSTFQKALRKKDILVNNIRIKENMIVHENDVITLYIVDDLLFKQFNIIKVYEDDNILVVNKPAGLEVISSVISLTSLLSKDYSFIEPCHRLDMNTTGLVVFAKNEQSLNILLQKFKDREIEKYYECTVYGIPKIKEATLIAYLFKNEKKSQVFVSDTFKKGYKKIITAYKVLSSNKEKNTSVLEVKLETGRTHQIRAHLAHIGFPIIGDGKYGINEINKKFNFNTQKLCAKKIIFKFSTDTSILNYLNGLEISL